MSYTIAQIAQALGLEAAGNLDLIIEGAAEPHDASASDLALAMDPKYAGGLAKGGAKAALLWAGADWAELGLEAALFTARARVSMAGLTALLDKGPTIAPGIHSSAIVDPSAQIGEGAAIGPFVVIEANVRIGARARIAAHSSIAEGAHIGDDLLLYAGARIGGHLTIGDRFIGQPSCVIGADGLAFSTVEKNAVESARETLGEAAAPAKAQSWQRIHSLGTVIIGDDVELGANSCIDRGTIRATRVGNGTKIDNLVHIAHNVEVGSDCLFAALVGIAGSTKVGNNVIFGGQVGVSDNITIGDNVVAGGGTKILSKVPAGRVVLGYPAVKMETHMDMYKALRRLPRMAGEFAELQKLVSKLDDKA
ncbi:MAG: UDP-3-O-[3-hydroxymyristoyl] glucosamine N-acyltransferase [Halocynthiibacter sp.]|jgi:UDP-3-O-[3-hydroxymyristoyl] glucosamine N-acyltransferase